jgi:iron complex transport system permease protein
VADTIRARRRLGTLLGTASLIVLAVLSIVWGSRPIPFAVVWEALSSFDGANDAHLIITELRVPRTVLGILVGAALGTAGAVMQAVTRNPLAEPGLLGVNAGASAAVVTAIVVAGSANVSSYIWAAFLGAGAAAVAVYALGGAFSQGANPVRLVLAGAALSVVLGAYTSAVVLNDQSAFGTFRFWSVGSLQGRGWDTILAVVAFVVIGMLGALVLARPLNALAMGSDVGTALGVSVRWTTIAAAGLIVLLAGSATAAAGPIGFIGLTAPLIARSIVGPDYRYVLPFSCLIAANVLLAADIVGRLVAFPGEVQTAIVMAIIGGPFFVAIVRRRKLATL